MSLTREDAHKLVDQIFDAQTTEPAPADTAKTETTEAAPEAAPAEEPKRVLPEGKRVARTKSSGDRVYYLDEVKKTRQWVYDPTVLESLGFNMGDVVEIEDSELLKYNMGPAILKPVGKSATS